MKKREFTVDAKSKADLVVAGDLLLELLDVSNELLARALEEKVAVDEPSGVGKADELHELGEEGDTVDGTDNGVTEPESDDGTTRVDTDGGLVLNPAGSQIKKRINRNRE